jgi:hypothetical protein
MIKEAGLEDVGSGLAPVSPGWFVVNVREAAWVSHEIFGAACVFQSDGRVLRERPDLDGQRFPQLGVTSRCSSPAVQVVSTMPSPRRRASSSSPASA